MRLPYFLSSLVNGPSFQVFLEKILLPKLWPGACVVLDNLSVHKVKGVKEKIESVGASLIYLSPYSPDFNPHTFPIKIRRASATNLILARANTVLLSPPYFLAGLSRLKAVGQNLSNIYDRSVLVLVKVSIELSL